MFQRRERVLLVGALIVFLSAPAAAQQGMMQQEMMPQGEGHMSQEGRMPMMGGNPHDDDDERYGHHHGDGGYAHHGWPHTSMMGHGMMGPGMMQQGMMMHPGMMTAPEMLAPRLGWPLAVPRALTVGEVEAGLQRLLEQTNNPNIELGIVEQSDDETFRATITTKDGSLVQTLSIDRFSGEMWQSD